MLKITISGSENYNEDTNEFTTTKDVNLQLEHSLVSVAKWEAAWNRPFLTSDEKTSEETLDYIRCMTITQNIRGEHYNNMTNDQIKKIYEYIDAPMTATTLPKQTGRGSREIVTSELIYYWMFTYNIPMECQKWHLNRLLTLIQVCNIKNQPEKKMSRSAIASRNRELNNQRRQAMNTKG